MPPVKLQISGRSTQFATDPVDDPEFRTAEINASPRVADPVVAAPGSAIAVVDWAGSVVVMTGAAAAAPVVARLAAMMHAPSVVSGIRCVRGDFIVCTPCVVMIDEPYKK
ncbi:hypothetical protein [Nocardia sp. NPDC056100]|uniref:hypothetical protein n=1 Tax=Nocardia sp. NPDC056100 TaxID=3345712 RepID=UPI0035E2CD99